MHGILKNSFFRFALSLVVLVCPVFGAEGPDYLILTPADLAKPAEMLARHRRETGYRVRVQHLEQIGEKQDGVDPQGIKGLIRKVHSESEGRLKYILLMGDAPAQADPKDRLRIPPKILHRQYVPNRRTMKMASDTWYGMLDNDPIPDLAVGRLPADDETEAFAMVQRIITYEKGKDFGPWRKRFNMVAGPSGGGPFEDLFSEYILNRSFLENIHPAYESKLIFALPSPYCYPPPTFPEKVIKLMNEGCRIWMYAGHGTDGAFGWFKWKDKGNFIFDHDSINLTDIRHGAPVMVLLTCSAGRFDDEKRDCISETLMKVKRGPVAVLSSSRTSNGYPNGILAKEILSHFMRPEHETIGKALLEVKRSLVESKGVGDVGIDRIAVFMKGSRKRVRMCLEDHVHLYNLFGDPALPIGAPKAFAEVHAPPSVSFGDSLEIRCIFDRPYEGEAEVTVETKSGMPLCPFEPVKGLSGKELLTAMEKNWKLANDRILVRTRCRVEDSSIRVLLNIPKADFPPGEYLIRVFTHDDRGYSVGWTQILLVAKSPKDEGEF